MKEIEEIYQIDFRKILIPLRKKYFTDIQTLCFAKNIGWFSAKKNYQDFTRLMRASSGQLIIAIYNANLSKHTYLAYGSTSSAKTSINYRDMIKKLRALK